MSQLDQIKKYAELLSKASKWPGSGDQILDIVSMKDGDSKKEYLYEFYCFLRIIQDLQKTYNIEIANTKGKTVFPKAPASKKNYPYFVAKDKSTGKVVFEICTSVDVVGLAKETSAPDISFHYPNGNLEPTHEDVFMLFDAKFKHQLTTNVHESEFNKVAAMVANLNTKDHTKYSIVQFDELKELLGNSLLTNSTAFKNNHDHHKIYCIKEVENFDVGKKYNVIG